MKTTQIKQIIWNAQQLKHDMEDTRNALATAVLIKSPAYVIESIRKEYADAKMKYDNYMELEIEISPEIEVRIK